MPKRIQRKRTRGWKMPENTVYVGRPSQWGNPFKPSCAITEGYAKALVHRYEGYLNEVKPELKEVAKRELRGKDLACWCKEGSPCHADVLLEIANS